MIQFATQPPGAEDLDTFLRDLLLADWTSSKGPLRLSANISLADLTAADFFVNTRLFLTSLAEEDGTPTTATGNLNRAFVDRMFDRLKLPAPSRKSIQHCCKVLNEYDLWQLHLARIISECARLVARRKKRFHVTKLGRALLGEEQAGALYQSLFEAYFTRFDLRYMQLRDVSGIQATVAVILWRIDAVARDWTPVRGLAPRILLPRVLDEMHRVMTYPNDDEEWILGSYLLDPLLDFGLIQSRKHDEWPDVTEKDVIRVTALWDKFIRFVWKGGTV